MKRTEGRVETSFTPKDIGDLGKVRMTWGARKSILTLYKISSCFLCSCDADIIASKTFLFPS